MLNIDSHKPIDFDRYWNIMNSYREVFIDVDYLRKCLDYDEELAKTLRLRVLEYMNFNSEGSVSYIDRESVMKYLTLFEGVNKKQLRPQNKNSSSDFSLDEDRVLRPLLKQGKAVEFLSRYLEYKKVESPCNNAKSMMNKTKPTELVDRNGKELNSLGYIYSKAATGRLYTREHSIQQIPLKYVKNICAPKGYFLLWGDLGQVDFRVAWHLYLQEPSTKVIYDKYEDKYEALSILIHMELGREFDREKFLEQRPLMKAVFLSRVYHSSLRSLTKTTGDAEFSATLNDYFLRNKRYQKILGEISYTISNYYAYSIIDHFGVERPIDTSLPESRKIRQMINSRVQSTSNGIMASFIMAVYDKLNALGVDPEWVKPYFLRHDEIVFLIDERFKPYLWVFEDLRMIGVDDWDTIQLEPVLGYNYTIPDESLMKEFRSSVEENMHKLTPRDAKHYLEESKAIRRECVAYLSSFKLENGLQPTALTSGNLKLACVSMSGDKMTELIKNLLELYKADDIRIFTSVYSKDFETKVDGAKVTVCYQQAIPLSYAHKKLLERELKLYNEDYPEVKRIGIDI